MPKNGKNSSSDGKTLLKERVHLKKPSLYKVVMHNDDFSTMEFVIEILTSVFGRNASTATKIMLDIHNAGKGIAGVYTLDIAKTKISTVHKLAKLSNFPLKCSHEKE